MSLTSSLSIATSGLSAVQYALSVAAQNVSNANTAGYVSESANVSSRAAGSQPSGVAIGLTTRATSAALQGQLYTQNAEVAALQTTNTSLSVIGALQGTTGDDSSSTNTLSDLVGGVQSALTTLEADPSSAVSQQAVVTDATSLTTAINSLADAYQSQRQSAQNGIVSDITSIGTDLTTIGSLSDKIVALKAQGQDTADLENQRSAAMSDLSSYVGVSYSETSTGDMLVATSSGLSLPTRASQGTLETQNATIGVASAYPQNIPAITLNGQDVTSLLTGGSLGANITLRDSTLPTMQAELDSFSATLSSRFQQQGLTLFTTASGATTGSDPTQLSPAGQVGYANTISVNPAVVSNPALVRDGDAEATSAVTLAATLPGNASGSESADVTVYDAVGGSHDMTLSWSQSSTDPQQWTVSASVAGADSGAASSTSATVTFGADGTISSISQNGTTTSTTGQAASLSLTTSLGGTGQTLSISLGSIGGSAVTQSSAATSFGVSSLTQNGGTSHNASGASGYTNLINSLLGTSLGSGQTAATVTGLGLTGALSADYTGSGSLSSLAATLTASQAATISAASNQLSTEQSVQTTLQSKVSSATGVDVDSQMSSIVSLQNAYEANAKVVSAIQSMFTALLDAVSA